MPKYIVTRGWHGVKQGTVLDLDLSEINKAFHSNLTLASDAAVIDRAPVNQNVDELPIDDLEPKDEFDWEIVRQDIIAELDDAAMEYNPEAPASELAAMLPQEVAEAIKLGAE